MRLGALLGVAALGGFAYMHKRRGGDMSLESLTATARSLFSQARDIAQPGTNSSRMYEGDDSQLRH